MYFISTSALIGRAIVFSMVKVINRACKVDSFDNQPEKANAREEIHC